MTPASIARLSPSAQRNLAIALFALAVVVVLVVLLVRSCTCTGDTTSPLRT
jgi:hypothetical protein